MKPVTVYTTDMCPYCRSAKALLDKRGVAYEEINLARDPDGRTKLHDITGMITFPQIVIVVWTALFLSYSIPWLSYFWKAWVR